MTPTDYIAGAATTTPPKLHHATIPSNVVANGLQAFADAGNNLNPVKKQLVYGPEKRPIPEDNPLFTGGYTHDHPTDTGDMPPEVLHGIVGMLTEGGELAELALTTIVGRDLPFDRANLREELGDQFWYIARILKAMQDRHPDENWSFEAIMSENLAKLDVRHKKPGETTGFNADAGGEDGRDRAAEQAAMEAAQQERAVTDPTEAPQAGQDPKQTQNFRGDPIKQSSSAMSTLAGEVMHYTRPEIADSEIDVARLRRDARSLAGSVISQDETKGQS